MKRALPVLLAIAVAATTSFACNIPVFRYALERWRPDLTEFIIFHRGELTEEDNALVDRLKSQSRTSNANTQLLFVDVSAPLSDEYDRLWSKLNDVGKPPLPYLIVRLPHARGPLNAWQGPLAESTQSALVESAVRSELSRRLLAGDAIVWLLVRSADEERNAPIRKLVATQCEQLSSKIQLPEGIGLPGSELFSEIPLFLKFSLLEISRNDPQEQFLVKLFEGFQPAAFRDGEPLLVPVFGRGRALEVIPADSVDQRLLEDLTAFLCGACSCQVKEQNPGFDLLLSADWDRELFGENGELPPPAKSIGEGDRGPALIPIPPGR